MSETLAPAEASERIFKNRSFDLFARSERIGEAALCQVVEQLRRGLVDANLGGGVVKQRIARPGVGKSGGFRSLIAFQVGRHTFFIYGFAKNERQNIRDNELQVLKKLAKQLLELSESQLDSATIAGELIEVKCDAENLQK